MTGPRPAGPSASLFRTDEFVVASAYQPLVFDLLAELGVQRDGLTILDEAPELGLSRVGLDAAAAARRLGPPDFAAAHAPAAPRDGQPHPLETVLHHLRTGFAERYRGWWPTLGKNRMVSHAVRAASQVIPGGDGAPRLMTGPGLPPRAAAGRDGDVRNGGVRVGVVDTALSPHPWLSGGYLATPADFLDAADLAAAANADNWTIGHATFVTGLILQHAPGATVEVFPGLGQTGQADSWSVARTIAGLSHRGLDVLNLSFGCYTEDDQPPLVLATALARLSPDLVVVAAAGNDADPTSGSARPWWPAAFDSVVAVGALDANGKRAPFSPDCPWVNLVARGTDQVSTYPAGLLGAAPAGADSYASWSGTSFSAAVVTGMIARSPRGGLATLVAGAASDDGGRPVVDGAR